MAAMNEEENKTNEESEDFLLAARRKKLDRICELGLDPWGQRFDNRQYMGDLRDRANEIKYVTSDGRSLDLPAEVGQEGFDLRGWLAGQGAGEMHGPTVRAAGRIVLHRDKGKLQFLDIQDWTGRIQLFVGRDQVGPENWELVQCLDLGDLIGVDGTMRRTKTGELSIFAAKIHILTKTLDPPPDKHKGLAIDRTKSAHDGFIVAKRTVAVQFDKFITYRI